MGSVTIIVIIPLMLIIMGVGSIAGAIKGDNVTEVVLPYNPSEGIVWECDGIDDSLFNLIETEIDGDEQIFIFKGNNMLSGLFDKSEDMSDYDAFDYDTVTDVVFTNKNGEELLYCACVDHDYIALNYKMKFWSPDEYIIFDYTPKAETYVDGAEWVSGEDSLIGETESNGEKTFTFRILPDKEKESIYKLSCTYRAPMDDGSGNYVFYEKIEVEIRTKGSEYIIKDEDRFYHEGSGWLSYNPALREK